MKKSVTQLLFESTSLLTARYCYSTVLLKSTTLAILFLAGFKADCFAQPNVLGTDILLGPPNYVTYTLNAVGGFKQFRIQASNSAAAGSIEWLFTNDLTYTNTWRPYSGSCNGNPNVQIAGYNTFIAPDITFPSITATATYSGNAGCPGYLPAVMAGNYYTFNVTNNGGTANNNMAVLETVYNPQTISSVVQSPATVGGTVSPTITVTLAAAPAIGENVYVRYSTDNFATSSIVQVGSFLGATGTANIPIQAAGSIVRYYVYSSPKTSAQIGTDAGTYGQSAHDMATLNLNNNGGSNYSYTVLPVTVNATNTVNDASYNTLAAAFAAINAGTHLGAINVWVSGNTAETGSAVLNASGSGASSYTSIIVRPSGLVRTVSGNLAAPLVDLNGADNVTIDGLNDGSNSLIISNANTGSTAGTSTIRMYNGATANIVQNCVLEGSATTASGGVVFFGTGINANISINSNNIRPAGASNPIYAVCGDGSSNSAITISGNNIQDYFSASQNSFGVFASNGSNAWTVSGNRFFQSSPRTINTAGAGVRAIIISSGGGHTISNNIIGYNNSGGTGTTSYTTTQLNNLIVPIQLTGDANNSNIQGNIISNISISTASNFTGVPGIFTGIYVSAGAVTVSSNTIGGTTGTGSISLTCSVTGTQLLATGITVSSLTPNLVSVQNNTVGSFNLAAASAGADLRCNFNGIFIPFGTSANCNIADNTIGSTVQANSVTIGVSSTGATNFTGINCLTSGTASATGNTIQNCLQSSTGVSTFTGMIVSNATGVLPITSNSIVSCSNAGSGFFTAINNTSPATALTISGNIIRSNTIATANSAFTGIVNSGAVSSSIIISNNQLGNASGGLVTFSTANSATLLGISNTGGSSATTLSIQSNDFRGIVHSVAGSGNHTYINNIAATLSQNISTNTFTALNVNSTGGITFISNSVSLGATGTKVINDNAIVTSFTKTGASAVVSFFYYDIGSSVAGTTVTNDGNNFSNVTITNPLQGWYNQDGSGTAPSKNITNNSFNNITISAGVGSGLMLINNGTGDISNNAISTCSNNHNITGLTVINGSFNIHTNAINTISATGGTTGVLGISITNGTTQNIYKNIVHTLSSTVAATFVRGVSVSGGTIVNVYKNKIYGISNTFSPLVSGGTQGISVSGGATVTVSNNLVGNLATPTANFDDAIRGISITGGTNVNVYYNSVYLNASSSGANFGSAALYASTTPVLDMRNNILYNISTPGATGRTVAYRRSGISLTNYAATSNNNFFLAGTPGPTRLIFYDGTNSDQQLVANYQPRVAPRDAVSVTAPMLPFISTTGSSLNFLHLNSTNNAESAAANIAGFTDDFDDETRHGNAGYTGTGTAPDIGADEFESIVCPTTPNITDISSPAPYYAGDLITITGNNLLGITYATINGINATIGTTTATTAQLTIPVTMTDSVGVIQVAASSSCAFSNTFNFVFAGFITKGGQGAVNWGTNTIWRNDALPVDNAPAIIDAGDNVTLNIAAAPIKFTILSGASLIHQDNSLVFGTTYLNNTTVDGTLTLDNAAMPVLSASNRFVSTKVLINNGGVFTNNSATALAVSIADFYVYAGGTYNHNAVGSTATGVVNDFPGSTLRSFGNTSNVVITKWANGGTGPINLPASGSPGWGNLTINVASLASSWNQSGTLTNIQGNLNIVATGGGTNEFRLTGNTPTSLTILGNLSISGGGFVGNTGSASPTITVSGNMNITGGYFIPCNNSGTTTTVNITGNCTLNGGHIVGAGSGRTYVMTMAALSVTGNSVLGLSQSSSSAFTLTTGSIAVSGSATMYSSSSGNITINCTGNFTSTSTGGAALVMIPVVLPTVAPQAYAFAFQNSNVVSRTYTLNLGGNFSVTGTGTFGGGSASSPASINFTGGAASATYTANPAVMSVITPSKRNNFSVASGKTLLLNSSIIPASTSGSNNWSFTVNTGGVLDFGTHSVGDPGLSDRYFVFTAQTGATLRSGHTGGILNWLVANGASITALPHNASLSDGATYVFNGSTAQASSIFRTTPLASPYNVANIIINNAAGVSLDTSYNVTAALQLQTGVLTLNNFDINTVSITGVPFSNTKMVNTNGTGMLGLLLPAGASNTFFPVGNGADYTPADYTFSANSTARYLSVRAARPRNSNDLSPTNYLNNRWWNTGLDITTGSYTYNASYTYIAGDVVGSAAAIRLNRWTGSTWVDDPGSSVNTGLHTLNSSMLTQATGPLAATAQWVGRTYVSPAVYHWNNPSGGSWLSSANWTPTGVPGSGDGVIFDAPGNPSYSTNNMPVGISLTQFTVSANNSVTFNAGGAGTINMIFPGTATPQFSIASGSAMTIAGSNVVNFNLPAGATGTVDGSLGLRQAAHTVTVADVNALSFSTGSYFSYGNTTFPGFSGHPFGSTGTNGAVLFNIGSVCECFEGSNPFGSAVADRIVTFNGGSLFRYSDPGISSPAVSGRTYANFTFNANKTTSITASNSFVCDSLTVSLGTFNLNLQGTPTPDHSIKGNINIANGATLTFSPLVSGTVNMNSGANQTIWGAGIFRVNSNAILDINAGTTVSLQKNMEVNNPLSTTQGRINVNGTLVCTGENYIASVPPANGGLVQLMNPGTISIQSIDGISTTGIGNIRTTNFGYTGSGGNFIYSGNANQATGNRLPLTLGGTTQLTIANTGTAPNDIVTLTRNNTAVPRLNLAAGQFNAGTGGTLIINGGTNMVVGTGGNQFQSGAATDNIIRFASNGAVSGTPELWNVTIESSGSGVDFQNNARINNIFLINSGGFVVNNAPNYNTGSSLIYNTGVGYNRALEWSNNSGLGNPGYPHHVTIQNSTSLNFLNTTTFDVGCGGNLNIGAATSGTLVLTNYQQPYDLFVKGNINIGNTAAGTLTMSGSVGSDLYLTGNWTRNALGTVNFGAGNGRSVYFEGSTDAIISASGGQYFPYVRMQKAAKANKVTLADHVSIGFEVTFTRGTLDLGTNNKFFSLLSNVNYDARVDVSDSANTGFVYGTDDVNGQFIVHRYFPARRAWRLVTAPLKAGGGTHSISQAWQERGNGATGLDYTAANWVASVATDSAGLNFATQITGGATADGFDASPNNNSSIKFFSGGGVWNTPLNTNNTSVNSQEGWLLFVRGDRESYGEITNQFKAATITTLRPRGQIFIGQKTITGNAMQTVGNPYASAVDYFAMTRTGPGTWPANPTYYVWDPYLGGSSGVGAWVTLTWNGTDFTRSAGTYDNRYIPSGAAIMVDFPAGGGTLSMNEANKNTDSNTTAFRPVRQLRTSLQAKDTDNGMYVADAALSLFGNDFNNEFDIDDARKLSNINENICLRRNSGYLSIERKKLKGDADTIFYYLNRLQKKDYQLRFDMESMEVPASTAAFLEDTYLKTKTPVSLSGVTEVPFAVSNDAASSAEERFRLVFRRSVWFSHIAADMLNSDVSIRWGVSDELNIDKYEIERSENGTTFATITTKVSNGNSDMPVSYSGIDVSPLPGEYYYRIRSISKNGIVSYSDVVKIRVVKASPQLYVFPNPVINNTIQLQLNNARAGLYTTVLYAANGQAVNNEFISHAGGTATKTIQPKQQLTSGTYQLMVTTPDAQVSSIKVLVTGK